MSIRKIDPKDVLWPDESCQDPEHQPPRHISLEPGAYEHSCPTCNKRTLFRVDARNRMG